MMLKELARTGVRISEWGLGTSNYRAGPLPLRKGLEAGALFIDTAESYGTESVVGEAVKGMRGRVFIASKVSPQNFRPAVSARYRHSIPISKSLRHAAEAQYASTPPEPRPANGEVVAPRLTSPLDLTFRDVLMDKWRGSRCRSSPGLLLRLPTVSCPF